MATINFLIPLLVTFMLITGVCNTLLTKYQVMSAPSEPRGVH
jgi:hypothetical protein